jgi:hypothetical protein
MKTNTMKKYTVVYTKPTGNNGITVCFAHILANPIHLDTTIDLVYWIDRNAVTHIFHGHCEIVE